MGNIVSTYTIVGCINGIKVTKIVTVFDTGCKTVEYSDGSDGTGWTENCPIQEFDAQLTCVLENESIYMMKWDEVQNTYLVFDLSTNPATDVTGTVTPVKCDDKELESDDIDWCVDGSNFTQWIVKENGNPNGLIYWTNESGTVVSDPLPTATVKNKGACSLSSIPLSIGSESLTVGGLTTLNPIAGSVYAVISILSGEIWITVDGVVPSIGVGHPAYEGQHVYLQIADEINDFQCFGNGNMFITYYDKPLLLSQQ